MMGPFCISVIWAYGSRKVKCMQPMFPKREQTMVRKMLGGQTYDQIYMQMLKPDPFEEWRHMSEEEKARAKPYPFNPRVYEAAPGVICEQDVAVEMRDGAKLYCDIFRPADSGEDSRVPAILAWSNYGKRPNEYRTGKDVGYTPGVPEGAVSDEVDEGVPNDRFRPYFEEMLGSSYVGLALYAVRQPEGDRLDSLSLAKIANHTRVAFFREHRASPRLSDEALFGETGEIF